MFEHVGPTHYREFFRKLKELLADDGVALLHSIGRMEPPGGMNPWIRKYIFPGGYTPALSEVFEAVQDGGLWVTDLEILRLHYAETLRAWRERFEANRDKIRALYDERFCRMWEFYLVGCELSFRYTNQMVFQMQIARATGRRAADARLHARLGTGRRPAAGAPRGFLESLPPPLGLTSPEVSTQRNIVVESMI